MHCDHWLSTNIILNGTVLHKDGEKFRAPIVKDALEVLDQRLKVELEWDPADPKIEYVPGDRVPVCIIALVVTMLECCLDEWKSGARVDLSFNAKSYAVKYSEHVANIRPLATQDLWVF
ncbi:hypothetical protein C8J56DRAFT_1157586 [Mycena floridula]|nr:hypothetical protein C8J56DRAFT_1157586 [Mycena floridula]